MSCMTVEMREYFSLVEENCSNCLSISKLENDPDAKCDDHTIKEETSFDDVLKQYS